MKTGLIIAGIAALVIIISIAIWAGVKKAEASAAATAAMANQTYQPTKLDSWAGMIGAIANVGTAAIQANSNKSKPQTA